MPKLVDNGQTITVETTISELAGAKSVIAYVIYMIPRLVDRPLTYEEKTLLVSLRQINEDFFTVSGSPDESSQMRLEMNGLRRDSTRNAPHGPR